MNLSLSSLPEISSFSPEVLDAYAFPPEQRLIRILKNETIIGEELKKNGVSEIEFEKKLSFGLLSVGFCSYMFLLFPAGKVVRDR